MEKQNVSITIRAAQQMAYAHVIEGRSWQAISMESGVPILVCQRVAGYWMRELEHQCHTLEQLIEQNTAQQPK